MTATTILIVLGVVVVPKAPFADALLFLSLWSLISVWTPCFAIVGGAGVVVAASSETAPFSAHSLDQTIAQRPSTH